MAHTASDMENMSSRPLSLQEQIIYKEQELKNTEELLNVEKKSLAKMKEQLERSQTPFRKWFRNYKDPKGIDHHGMYEFYKVGWNAAMKEVFAELQRRSLVGNWLYDYIYDSIK